MRQLRDRLRAALRDYFETPGVKFFQALHVSPNGITMIGFVLSLVAGYLAAIGQFRWAGVVFLLSGSLDLLDGSMARSTGKATNFGAMLDSVIDRLTEAAILGGIAWWNATRGDEFAVGLAFGAMIASFMVSYMRARGEGLGIETKLGIMTRPERVVVLSLGLLIPAPQLATAVIAVLAGFTVLQRLFHLSKHTGDR